MTRAPVNGKRFLTLFLFLSPFTFHAPSLFAQEETVRVLIFSTTSIIFSGESVFAMDSSIGKKNMPQSFEAHPEENGLRIGRHLMQTPLRLSASGPIEIGGNLYRGEILLHKEKGWLLVINEIPLEEYLLGVVPKEVPEGFPQEALKAQAVVSRTFLLKNIGKYPNGHYQITATVLDQVYGGMSAERPQTSSAVYATRGEVIVNGSGLINAVMHDNCGGHTENAAHVWPGDVKSPPKYLQGVACIYCRGAPWYRWSSRFSKEEIGKALASLGVNMTPKSILPRKWCQTGRARRVLATPSRGKARSLSSQRFRMALGPHRFRSTRFTVNRAVNGDFIFKGRGWGHGVGFCQWGARGQALKKRGYARILKFYFPGTKLVKIHESDSPTKISKKGDSP